MEQQQKQSEKVVSVSKAETTEKSIMDVLKNDRKLETSMLNRAFNWFGKTQMPIVTVLKTAEIRNVVQDVFDFYGKEGVKSITLRFTGGFSHELKPSHGVVGDFANQYFGLVLAAHASGKVATRTDVDKRQVKATVPVSELFTILI